MIWQRIKRWMPALMMAGGIFVAAVAQPPRLAQPAKSAKTVKTVKKPKSPLLQPDTTPIRPTIPTANRNQPGRLFLEGADSLIANEMLPNAQVLVGNVKFRRGAMYMYCDSAIFYSSPTQQTDSMEAYGNVRMQQGDTLFLYGDEMEYSGFMELATIYAEGNNMVRLINRDVKLTTQVLHYDVGIGLGYYDVGGTLTDPNNTLRSLEGEYIPSTKEANFYTNVKLDGRTNKGDTVLLFTDTLTYNTQSRTAYIVCPSKIISRDGVILSSNGDYNTATNVGWLYDRSLVLTKRGNTLTGDTLYCDRTNGIGEAFGSMVLTDSTRQVTLEGDYGYYSESNDSSYCTGRARAMEYSHPDTLYLHGRVIRSWSLPDSTHMMVAAPRVRFYRADVQGICDSMTMVEADSTLRMDIHPVVWTDQRQVFGNEIRIFFNDSTVDRMHLPDFGFAAEHLDEDLYNQLSGREMMAYMLDGHLRQLDVNGSVQMVIFPQENDSTFNKVANLESSYLKATFANDEIDRAKLWSETSGTVTPLYLAKKSLYTLPKFKWYESLRPTSPESIFIISDEMDQLMRSAGD